MTAAVAALLVQITDSHVTAGPEGDAAAAALAQVVDAVGALPIPPTAVLLSGDLADDGAPASYARVRELVAPLRAPLHVIPGNHDSPAIWDAFARTEAVDVGDLRLVQLDSTIPGAGSGRVDLEALEALLDDRPTVVAMHHPPLRTGVKAIDAFGIPDADREGLAALLARSPQVQRVVCGHVHRTTFETLGGVGVFSCPATYEQAEPDPAGGLAWVERGRAFAIHSWARGALLSQIQPV